MQTASPTLEGHVDSPLSARERIFNVAKLIMDETATEGADTEVWAIIEEQFIGPDQRTHNRYMRKADEMLCQKLERDQRFQEACAIARGEVFG